MLAVAGRPLPDGDLCRWDAFGVQQFDDAVEVDRLYRPLGRWGRLGQNLCSGGQDALVQVGRLVAVIVQPVEQVVDLVAEIFAFDRVGDQLRRQIGDVIDSASRAGDDWHGPAPATTRQGIVLLRAWSWAPWPLDRAWRVYPSATSPDLNRRGFSDLGCEPGPLRSIPDRVVLLWNLAEDAGRVTRGRDE